METRRHKKAKGRPNRKPIGRQSPSQHMVTGSDSGLGLGLGSANEKCSVSTENWRNNNVWGVTGWVDMNMMLPLSSVSTLSAYHLSTSLRFTHQHLRASEFYLMTFG